MQLATADLAIQKVLPTTPYTSGRLHQLFLNR